MVDSHHEEILSKTRRKRLMHELQCLGEALVALPTDKLAHLDLPENLREAVLAARRITAHGARRRQLQYIGKLMRHVDAAPIQAKLAQWQHIHLEETARFHRVENWRRRLIEEDAALSEFVARYPTPDIQHLRMLVRNARKEAASNQPPKSSRQLFRLMKEIMTHE
ncbi:MAG: DUF615 domain-containing protein [Methylophilaceae bacterium]|nr:DUF615 domain-containing protein [Methylophilaceae bacterium]